MNLLRITAAAVVLLTAFGQDDLHTISEQEMDFIMNDIDDGDGKLNADEIVRWMKDDLKKKMHLLTPQEKTEIENLTDEEYLESANDMIREGDQNSDGFLSRDEFWSLVHDDNIRDVNDYPEDEM